MKKLFNGFGFFFIICWVNISMIFAANLCVLISGHIEFFTYLGFVVGFNSSWSISSNWAILKAIHFSSALWQQFGFQSCHSSWWLSFYPFLGEPILTLVYFPSLSFLTLNI